MPSSPRARIALLTSLAASALLLSACGSSAATEADDPTPGTAETSTPLPSSGNQSPVATPAVTPISPEDVTCENLLTAEALAQFEDQGWTYREDPFAVEGIVLDGLVCSWADYSAATSNIFVFGWAPATPDEMSDVETALEATGWLREEDAGSLYITEDPAQAMTTDENNYGMTYQLGEDWITVSDTKQNLLFIEVPAT